MNAVKVVLAAGVVLLAAQISGWHLLDRLFYTLAGLLALALGLSLLSLRGVRLIRQTSGDRGQVGQVFVERLRLENASRLGKLWVEVQDGSTLPGHQASRVTGLAGRGQIAWTVSTLLQQRGRYQLGPARLRAGDPFGLFPARRALQGTQELLVYPAIVPLGAVPVQAGDLPGGNASYQRTPQATPSIAGIRDYSPSDGFNRIAWSTTARLGRLMVKEFDLDPTADVWVVLDMDRAAHPPPLGDWVETDPREPWRASTEEFSVVVAASLAQHFLAQKRAVGLVMAGQHTEVIAAERGARQSAKLLEALAVIRAEGGMGLGELLVAEARRFGRHSTLVIVTPSADERWTPALHALARGGTRASVVLVEAATFGGTASPLLAIGQLAALRVPTLIVKRQDDLSQALGQASLVGAGPWPPGRRPGGA